MKLKLLFPFLFFFALVQAQPPEGYYDEAYGLIGYDLKTELSEITGEGYDQRSYGDLWTFFNQNDLDRFYENDNTILDIYSEDPAGEDPYVFNVGSDQCGNYSQEGDCYNREHLMPQSWFNGGYPMRTDVNHIFPSDGYVNAIHGHMPFGEVTNANHTSYNGSKRGANSYNHPSAYTGEVFEPIDEFKGDIARAYLYMAVRYEDQIAGWENSNSGSQNTLNGTSDQVFNDWSLSMLLEWHNEDPVSQREIERNDHTYDFQGNRNPFIDHPEFADMIWNPDEAQNLDEVFEEDFNDCELVAGTFLSVSEMSAADWTCLNDNGQYDSGAMEMYAMVGGQDETSLDWLITAEPLSFENSSEEELSFFAASTYGNTPLQILYSTEYDGTDNPSDFEWHTIPGVSIPTHTGIDNQEIRHYFSGIDISFLTQDDFYLAFRYDNTNGQEATRWVVDDVNINGTQEMSTPENEIVKASVYPNPTQGNTVYMELPNSNGFDYVLYDMYGRMLKEETTKQNKTSIQVGDLQTGVYLIHLKDNDKKVVKRLIIR